MEGCLRCLSTAKVHTKAPLEPFLIPERQFEHVNVDMVGALPPSQGFTHLTMMDRSTRWLEVVPLSSTISIKFQDGVCAVWKRMELC